MDDYTRHRPNTDKMFCRFSMHCHNAYRINNCTLLPLSGFKAAGYYSVKLISLCSVGFRNSLFCAIRAIVAISALSELFLVYVRN